MACTCAITHGNSCSAPPDKNPSMVFFSTTHHSSSLFLLWELILKSDVTLSIAHLPAGVPLQILSLRYTSEDPVIFSCDSAHLPPYLVQWKRDGVILSDEDSFSFSSRLIHRENSTYENTLAPAAGQTPAGTTYKCTVTVQIQPYSRSESFISNTCEPPNISTLLEYIVIIFCLL